MDFIEQLKARTNELKIEVDKLAGQYNCMVGRLEESIRHLEKATEMYIEFQQFIQDTEEEE